MGSLKPEHISVLCCLVTVAVIGGLIWYAVKRSRRR